MAAPGSHVRVPVRELHFTFVRSSGAGGQNVAKVSTKAVLRWSVRDSTSVPEAVRRRFMSRYGRRVTVDGDLVLTSQRFRNRARNVADCIEKLREMLTEVASPPRPRKPTRPTRSAIERRLREKRLRARRKELRMRPSSRDAPE